MIPRDTPLKSPSICQKRRLTRIAGVSANWKSIPMPIDILIQLTDYCQKLGPKT
jgi:hypothetical protein